MRFARSLLVTGGLVAFLGVTVAVVWSGKWPSRELATVADKASSHEGEPLHRHGLWSDASALSSQPTDVAGRDGQNSKTQLLRREMALLKEEVDALRKQLKSLTAVVAELPNAADVKAIAAGLIAHEDQGILQDAQPIEADLAQRDEEKKHYLNAVENSLQNEPIDTQWSSQAINEIEQALFNDQLLGTAVVDIDCRSTLCRLEVAHDDPQAEAYFQGLFSGLISNSLLQPALIHTDQGDGWNSTVIYLTREGYELPKGG